jgi:hypothetical protein
MRCAYIYIYLYAHGPVHSSVVSSAKKDFFLISPLVKQMGASLSEVHREALLLWFF